MSFGGFEWHFKLNIFFIFVTGKKICFSLLTKTPKQTQDAVIKTQIVVEDAFFFSRNSAASSCSSSPTHANTFCSITFLSSLLCPSFQYYMFLFLLHLLPCLCVSGLWGFTLTIGFKLVQRSIEGKAPGCFYIWKAFSLRRDQRGLSAFN